jgi:hypothetical protein
MNWNTIHSGDTEWAQCTHILTSLAWYCYGCGAPCQEQTAVIDQQADRICALQREAERRLQGQRDAEAAARHRPGPGVRNTMKALL